MKNDIVATATYNPEFEATRLASMPPHVRHEHMIDQHHETKARRREDHRKGLHRMRFPAGTLK